MSTKSSGSSERPRRLVLKAARHGEIRPASPNKAFRILAKPRHLGFLRPFNAPPDPATEWLLTLKEPLFNNGKPLRVLICLWAPEEPEEVVHNGLKAYRYVWKFPEPFLGNYRWFGFSTLDLAQATVERSEPIALGDGRTLHLIDLDRVQATLRGRSQMIMARNRQAGLYNLDIVHDEEQDAYRAIYTCGDPETFSGERPSLQC